MPGVSGQDEQDEAKRWATINAKRMKIPCVVVGWPNGNSESYSDFGRARAVRNPMVTFMGWGASWLILGIAIGIWISEST